MCVARVLLGTAKGPSRDQYPWVHRELQNHCKEGKTQVQTMVVGRLCVRIVAGTTRPLKAPLKTACHKYALEFVYYFCESCKKYQLTCVHKWQYFPNSNKFEKVQKIRLSLTPIFPSNAPFRQSWSQVFRSTYLVDKIFALKFYVGWMHYANLDHNSACKTRHVIGFL